jgi:glycosyltransferase involved in cell wall biosynthesis
MVSKPREWGGVMRIAIPPIGGDHWLGGWHYMLNMVSALSRGGGDDVETVLFVGTDIAASRLAAVAGLPRTSVVQDPVFNAAHKSARLAWALATGLDSEALALFRREKIDVVFEPATFFGWRFPLPAVGWIADFQHLHLPRLFSRSGRVRRSTGFRAQILSGRTIMLSSADAASDCVARYPGTRSMTRIVRFAVRPPPRLAYAEARKRISGFKLPTRFALLPNQFWVHKNHMIVVDAMARLRDRGGHLVVAMTGHGVDPRAPEHLERIRERVSAHGLEQQVRLLGSVPYEQLQALMCSAAVLINPSLFEGWSTTVEEAKAIGLPMILSDIAVHREQAEGEALFFDPRDAEALCRHLLSFEDVDEKMLGRDRPDARRRAEARHALYGRELADVFRETSARA